MTRDQIAREIQSFLADGLAIIVGSGLSVAEGIPGMGGLAQHLRAVVPTRIHPGSKDAWDSIETRIADGVGLEEALAGITVTQDLEDALVETTGTFLRESQNEVVDRILAGKQTLRISQLAPLLPPTSTVVPIVTTNYDCLLELGCELAGKGVDTTFVGSTAARLDPGGSRYSFCRGVRRSQRKLLLHYEPRIQILKPHGSLNWYRTAWGTVSCQIPSSVPPLIIPPGETKYRAGYKEPFDKHREIANRRINEATRYIIIGYSFNDDHLQEHLTRNLRDGKPCLVVTRTLTSKARAILTESPRTISLEAASTDDQTSIFTYSDGSTHEISGRLWDLGSLIEEVLQ